MFGSPKPAPAPVAPSVADKDIQDQANADRIRRAQAIGRSATILNDNTSQNSNSSVKKTLLGD